MRWAGPVVRTAARRRGRDGRKQCCCGKGLHVGLQSFNSVRTAGDLRKHVPCPIWLPTPWKSFPATRSWNGSAPEATARSGGPSAPAGSSRRSSSSTVAWTKSVPTCELKALLADQGGPPSVPLVPGTHRGGRRPTGHHHRTGRCEPEGPLRGMPRCRPARHPREELLDHLRDAADALDYMSERFSLQHLDIKPENLLIVGGRVKVADFGLVKDVQEATISLMGGLTPMYAAPEVFHGHPSLHSDQYSLAIVYQEMLTGTLPFPGRHPGQLAAQHQQIAPRLMSLPPEDRAAVARAGEKARRSIPQLPGLHRLPPGTDGLGGGFCAGRRRRMRRPARRCATRCLARPRRRRPRLRRPRLRVRRPDARCRSANSPPPQARCGRLRRPDQTSPPARGGG